MGVKEQNKMDVILVEGQTIYLDPNDEGAMEKLKEANEWGLGPIVKENDSNRIHRQESSAKKRTGMDVHKSN